MLYIRVNVQWEPELKTPYRKSYLCPSKGKGGETLDGAEELSPPWWREERLDQKASSSLDTGARPVPHTLLYLCLYPLGSSQTFCFSFPHSPQLLQSLAVSQAGFELTLQPRIASN